MGSRLRATRNLGSRTPCVRRCSSESPREKRFPLEPCNFLRLILGQPAIRSAVGAKEVSLARKRGEIVARERPPFAACPPWRAFFPRAFVFPFALKREPAGVRLRAVAMRYEL